MLTFQFRPLLRHFLHPGRVLSLLNRNNFTLNMPAPTSVLMEKMGSVFIIGLNRPEKRNAFNRDLLLRLKDAFGTFEEDSDANVALLHGKGGNFSVGYDVDEIVDNRMRDDILAQMNLKDVSDMFGEKPVVASVNGYALAAGLQLACCCDYRVVEEGSMVSFSGLRGQPSHIDISDSECERLGQLLGLTHSLSLVLTGKLISAQEAHHSNVANVVVATGSGLGRALNVASELAKRPPSRVRRIRRLLYQSACDARYAPIETSTRTTTSR